MSEFTHLHLHTQYSLIDGATRMTELMGTIKAYNMKAVAITDHGNMFGAIDFYKRAKEAGIKPIIGCEMYIAPLGRKDRSKRFSYHLTVLAKNNVGYKNLMYLVSIANLEGFYYNPRIDMELLREHSEGLMAFSGCLAAEIPRKIVSRDYEAAKKAALLYIDIFGKENFYLEVMNNQIPDQDIVNEGLMHIQADLGLPFVGTNDCHYKDRIDAKAQEILMCIQTQKTLADKDRLKHDVDSFYIKTPEQMKEDLAKFPGAYENTETISRMCNVEIELGKTYLPDFKIDELIPKEDYLRRITFEGLQRRFLEDGIGDAEIQSKYTHRLNKELDVINAMGFAGYFLIVWDFIKYAKDKKIPVGPGRGSGAGSLVAYSLGITNINPIKHNLLFERFLNPERISMPDFDIDFCMNRRDEVIKYVVEKYGKLNVAQIITYSTLKARGVIRDVGRVMGLPYADVDRVAKLVPEVLDISLEEAIRIEPELKKMKETPGVYKQLLDYAETLEGLNRQAGIHAAGIVISDKPIWEYTPIHRGNNGEIVTQYAKDEVEQVGLIKFDFLGLRTLTVIAETERLITKYQDPNFTIEKISLEDKKTYETLASGRTTGVFQLESAGLQELIRKIKPDCFEDVVAAVALYRPGPLGSGMVEDFWKRKHKLVEIKYPHPLLAKTLTETYGVIVYQEQVMKIAADLAGFSLGQADILRRAMGKKKPEEMAKLKQTFIKGAWERNKIKEAEAVKIFDLMEYFAGYGFNKSHSAAYALISYQTAFLKTYFPEYFMAAILTSEKDNLDKISKYLSECSDMGIELLPPDSNTSELEFTVEEKKIRYGFSSIKNVGDAAGNIIIEDRRKNGPFKDFNDFCSRVDLGKVNKRVIESLIKTGAFDFTKHTRAVLMSVLDEAMGVGSNLQKERDSSQLSLFTEEMETTSGFFTVNIPDIPEYDEKTIATNEKELLGYYFTVHPIAKYKNIIGSLSKDFIQNIKAYPDGKNVLLAGISSNFKAKLTKKGAKMAFMNLEDGTDYIEVIIFPKTYEIYADILMNEELYFIKGHVSKEGENARLVAGEIKTLNECFLSVKNISIELASENSNKEKMEKLKHMLGEIKGNVPLHLLVAVPNIGKAKVKIPNQGINLDETTYFNLEKICGSGSIRFTI